MELKKKVVKDGFEFIVQFSFSILIFMIIFGIPYFFIHSGNTAGAGIILGIIILFFVIFFILYHTKKDNETENTYQREEYRVLSANDLKKFPSKQDTLKPKTLKRYKPQKVCPKCGYGNLQISTKCRNCNYEFEHPFTKKD